jgi:hypothetical protein
LTGTIHVANGLSINNDVKNNEDYPDATPQPIDRRRVTIENMKLLFDPTPTVGTASDLFKALADRLDDNGGAVHIGNAAGYIWDFDFPKLYVRAPRLESDGGRKVLTCSMAARCTATLDDEMNLESR